MGGVGRVGASRGYCRGYGVFCGVGVCDGMDPGTGTYFVKPLHSRLVLVEID